MLYVAIIKILLIYFRDIYRASRGAEWEGEGQADSG